MKVAIPTEQGQIAQRLEHAEEFTIYDVEIELVQTKEILPLEDQSFSDFLLAHGINAIICCKIRSAARTLLRTRRIELTYGVTGNADDVMIRYLSGERLGTIEENALLRLEQDDLGDITYTPKRTSNS